MPWHKELYTFLACSAGHGLVSASPNAVNQSIEVLFDVQMACRKNILVVRELLTPEHALLFAIVSGVGGGSVVGAIPSGMGWASCVNFLASAGALLIKGILYVWQFSYFNGLSWKTTDYSKAGCRIKAISNPDLCCRKNHFEVYWCLV